MRDAILTHPWVSAPDQHKEEILEDPQYLSGMAVYLNAVEQEIPPAVLKTLGMSYSSVELHGEYYRGSVRLITSVFEQGAITVLVGDEISFGRRLGCALHQHTRAR